MEIASLTIDQVRDGLRARKFSSVELTTEALRFAAAENPKTNAYLTFSEDRALGAARRVDEKLAHGEDPSPLGGVPVAMHDGLVNKCVRTPCSCRVYAPAV